MRLISGNRSLALILAATVGASAPSLAQKGPPPAEAERTLRELVRVMGVDSQDTLRRFVEQRFLVSGPGSVPVEARVERLAMLGGMFGKLDIRDVSTATQTEVSATVQSGRTEQWRQITLWFDSVPPHRILRVGLRPASAPDAPARRLSDAEIVEQLRAYVERMAKRDAFSGTVLLAKRGRPLYNAAFGEANKDYGVQNTIDTKFNLGSMNKMFTAVAVMQLAEAGKLSLDDSLGKFLKAGAMRPEVLSKVRVKHLLTHTSGLGSYFNPRWDSLSRTLFRSVDDWMGLIKNDSLEFEPGTRWSYSNTGMLVLGKVIEAASGQDYFDYIRERIYKPAGMTNSDSYELDRVIKNLAIGYDIERTAKGAEYRPNTFYHVLRGGPAGGGYSTVGDLTRFAAALVEGKLVSRDGVKQLTTPKPEISSPRYGFGFGIEENGRIVGHGGGFPGINSQLDIFVEEDYTLAVMSNYSMGAQPVVEKGRALILAGRAPTASR
jgi:CubicO group peptidase (beta-lactamase class C family)